MNKEKNTADKLLLGLIDKLCHYIAFETTPEKEQSSLDFSALNDMGLIDSSTKECLEKKEDIINQLFALTNQGGASREIAGLAESFGLMIVKLEVWEIKQKELIDELKKKNADLELAKQKLGEQNRSLVVSLRDKYSPAQLVGQCKEMQEIMQMALNIAKRPINTLILGASGTGKEVFAKIIHFNSPRADRPFVAINCTAIPDSLFESEMFGIEKGVATGVSERKGLFEQAHTGTIFLDEIGDMSLVNQAKLLRVLEEQEVMRVGGKKNIKIDVKIISATNAKLKQAVEQGKFREDLYYRLNVVELNLPALNRRGEDIVILAEKLLAKNCAQLARSPISLSDAARQCLLDYDWPGNVRELNNEMERAAALTVSDVVEAKDLSAKFNCPYDESYELSSGENECREPDTSKKNQRTDFNLAEVEKQVISQALDNTGNNKTKAAALLGITREGLRKKLIRFEKANR